MVSGSTTALRASPVDLGARREMVWMGVKEEPGARRVVRMLEPVRPVEPKRAMEVIVVGLTGDVRCVSGG